MLQKTMVILLVDDDDGHSKLVEMNLKRAGIVNEFVRARDGEEALDYVFSRKQYANHPLPQILLILLDINMPQLNGVETLRQIKADDALKNIPVIMLTTTDDPHEVQRCYDLGCNVYITKPVEYDQFAEAIQRFGLFLQVIALPQNYSGGTVHG